MDRFTNHFSIQTSVHGLDNDERVSDLIDNDTNWWKTNLVKEVFMEEEVEKICSMSICPATQSDKIVWVGTKNGNYSVRSGYHMAKENSVMVDGGTSNPSLFSHLWKMVWYFRGPGTVKIFLWRACSDILPTKKNLFKHGIVEDQFCPIRGYETESLGHAIWT